MDQTLLLIPVTVAAYRLGIHAWNSWCVAMLVILATGVQTLNANILQDSNGLPVRGINLLQEAYRFKAFDCDKPEDALIQNIPHECPME